MAEAACLPQVILQQARDWTEIPEMSSKKVPIHTNPSG